MQRGGWRVAPGDEIADGRLVAAGSGPSAVDTLRIERLEQQLALLGLPSVILGFLPPARNFAFGRFRGLGSRFFGGQHGQQPRSASPDIRAQSAGVASACR